MKPLIRALLGAAAALPAAAGAQVVRPITPMPPPTVMIPFPTVTVTVQFPLASAATPLSPATQVPTLTIAATTPAATVAATTPAATVAYTEPAATESNMVAVPQAQTIVQTRSVPGSANVMSQNEVDESVDGDGDECDYEDGNATGDPNACADNGTAAWPAAPAGGLALDWRGFLLLFACGALVVSWIGSILRR